MNETKWWKNPQGLVAATTIIVMILGFFYVREKLMWEQSSRIKTVEDRGATVISQFATRFERLEQTVSQTRDQVNFLERKIDHLEFDVKNIKEHNPQ